MSELPPITVPLQTFQRAYAEICAGEGPWIALGKFMHQFFGTYKAFRSELVRDSIELPDDLSPDLFRWAVFCAASVEYLCHIYSLSCPAWAMDEQYSLQDPWYYDLASDLLEVQEELRETTPEEFARRNVFCGDNVYRNKYEHPRRRKIA